MWFLGNEDNLLAKAIEREVLLVINTNGFNEGDKIRVAGDRKPLRAAELAC